MEEFNYYKTIVAGLVASAVIVAIWTGLAVWLEEEYKLVIIFGIAAIAGVVAATVPSRSLLGAVFAAVLSLAAFLVYDQLLKALGYVMEDGDIKHMVTGIAFSLIGGAWIGYNKK